MTDANVKKEIKELEIAYRNQEVILIKIQGAIEYLREKLNENIRNEKADKTSANGNENVEHSS